MAKDNKVEEQTALTHAAELLKKSPLASDTKLAASAAATVRTWFIILECASPLST